MNKWTLPDGSVLRLVTPAELAALPDGTALRCIDGEVVVKGQDAIDGDTRFGYLAFGLPADASPRTEGR
jgi:hypothetical protein